MSKLQPPYSFPRQLVSGPFFWASGFLLLFSPLPLMQVAGAWLVLLVAPGYAPACRLSKPGVSFGLRINLASAVGFILAPIYLLLLRAVSFTFWSILFLSALITILTSLLRRKPVPPQSADPATASFPEPRPSRPHSAAGWYRWVSILFIVIFFILLCLPGIRFGTSFGQYDTVSFLRGTCPEPEVYPRLYSNDFFKHMAFTTELQRADHFMPRNPFLAAEPLRYYWFYPLVSAGFRELTGLSPALLQLILILAVALFFCFCLHGTALSIDPSGRLSLTSVLLLLFCYRFGHLARAVLLPAGNRLLLSFSELLELAGAHRFEILITTYLDLPLNALFSPHGLLTLSVALWILRLTMERMESGPSSTPSLFFGLMGGILVMYNSFLFVGLLALFWATSWCAMPRPGTRSSLVDVPDDDGFKPLFQGYDSSGALVPTGFSASPAKFLIPLLPAATLAVLLYDFRSAGLLVLCWYLFLGLPRCLPPLRTLVMPLTVTVTGLLLALLLIRGQNSGPLFAFQWGAWIRTVIPAGATLHQGLITGATGSWSLALTMTALIIVTSLLFYGSSGNSVRKPSRRSGLLLLALFLLPPLLMAWIAAFGSASPAELHPLLRIPMVNWCASLLLLAKLGPAVFFVPWAFSALQRSPLLIRVILAGCVLVFTMLTTGWCFDGRDFVLKISLLHRVLMAIAGGFGLHRLMGTSVSPARRVVLSVFLILALGMASPSLMYDLAWTWPSDATPLFRMPPDWQVSCRYARHETAPAAVIQAWGLKGRERYLVPVFMERRTLWAEPFHSSLGIDPSRAEAVRRKIILSLGEHPESAAAQLHQQGADYLALFGGISDHVFNRFSSAAAPDREAHDTFSVVSKGPHTILFRLFEPAAGAPVPSASRP